jgi:uncharacterized membrane protein
VFLVFILIIELVERMIPLDFIVLGVRLGFSNIVVLPAIYLFRTRYARCLVVMKYALFATPSLAVFRPSSTAYAAPCSASQP